MISMVSRTYRHAGYATLAGLVVAAAGALPALANVQPAALFSDHMVLQQGMRVPVWGTAAPGEAVTVTLNGQKQSATAGPDGRWQVRLTDLKSGGPYTMTIAGKNTVTVTDVLVGEVWLASGQSNMDFTVAKTAKKSFAGTMNEAEEIAAADYPQIRMFTVDLKLADDIQPDVQGHWAICSPQTVGDMSAVAYFFARDLYKERKVPFGVIDSTWGASTAQCWTRREALAAVPVLKPLLDDYATQCADYASGATQERYKTSLAAWETASAKAKEDGTRAPRKPGAPRDPHQDQHNPFLLYNGMIAPVKPYAIRGAIWYQGESNGPTAPEYVTLMKTLIGDWRQAWGEGDFPFLYVQIAAYGKPATDPVAGVGGTPRVREGQLQTLQVPNTAMASAIDIGDPTNIHPKNKQEVGRRLALAARARAYGEKIPASGPLYAGMVVEGGAIRVRFTATDGGLTAKDGAPLVGFIIAGADGKWFRADARIDGATVLVSSPSVPQPVAARYAWAPYPEVSLFNGAGLPASPFRTDTGDGKASPTVAVK